MIDWSKIRYFTLAENWGDPYKVHHKLVEMLDELREIANKPIIIHEAYATKGHSPNSYHYLGMAVDCHIIGLNVIDQYLLAERLDWGGIGVYGKDVWRFTPGLHLDIRTGSKARWGAKLIDGNRQYVELDSNFIKHLVELEDETAI